MLHLRLIFHSASQIQTSRLGPVASRLNRWTAAGKRSKPFSIRNKLAWNRALFFSYFSKIAVNFSLNFSLLGSTIRYVFFSFSSIPSGSRRLISWPQQFHLNESPLWSIFLFHKASFSFHAFEAYSEAIYPREKDFQLLLLHWTNPSTK